MIFSILVMAVVGKALYDRGYATEKIIPMVLVAGLIGYFIPIGAIVAWPFKVMGGLIGGIIGFFGGIFGIAMGGVGSVAVGITGGVGGLIGGVMTLVFGIIGIILGIIGAVIGLAFGLVALALGLIFVLVIPAALLFVAYKLIR